MHNWLANCYHKLLKKKNSTYLKKLIKNGLVLGKNVTIIEPFFFDPSHCFLISIGDNCIISPGVRLIAHDASTKNFLGYTKIGKIKIGENCFIGDSVIVLPCVEIGAGSIIGAGSVVTHDISPGMVAAGIPAKPISSVDEYIKTIEKSAKKKKIFNEEYFIEKLNKEKREEILNSVDKSLGFIV